MIRSVLAALIFVVFLSIAATAEPVKTFKTYVLSESLVEEVFQKLARQPYGDVAAVISKLQAEIQHQPAPPSNPRKE